MDEPQITVNNNELRTVREAMREMTALLELLENGSVEKIVLTRQGKIVGVLVAPYRYEELDPAT